MTGERVSESPANAGEERDVSVAALLARALSAIEKGAIERGGVIEARRELQSARDSFETAARALSDEMQGARAALESAAGRLEAQIEQEKAQRLVMSEQLISLTSSIEGLVGHLQELCRLMTDLLKKVAEPSPPTLEAPFPAGGEGVSLVLTSVPGFQGLMEIQKALTALTAVTSASVERFQDGDARIGLRLGAPLTATAVAEALRNATGYDALVEESKPELLRLRIKIVSGAASA